MYLMFAFFVYMNLLTKDHQLHPIKCIPALKEQYNRFNLGVRGLFFVYKELHIATASFANVEGHSLTLWNFDYVIN